VTADNETIEGSYELVGENKIKLIYSDDTVSVPEYHISYDRFGLISSGLDRKQVFMRIP
jgi:hypothetical protein